MKPLFSIALALALAALATASFGAARHYGTATLSIERPWSRATPAGIANGAVYMIIRNKGQAAEALLGATTEVSATTELHETVMVNGMMEMRPIPAIKIAAGKTVKIQPGGLHIMLLNLKHALKAGDRFPMTLHFAHAGDVQVEVVIANAKGEEMHMQAGDKMNMGPPAKGGKAQ
jgi:copper(I)-binding protein